MNSTEHFSVRPMEDRVKASGWWTIHFRGNREREWNIPWEDGIRLDDEAQLRIASSIAEFQCGESSEARTYLAKSEEFSGRTGDPHFHATSVLFVCEENGHAALLGRFMDKVGISKIAGSAGDRIFRRLRSVGDIGWSSRVLIIAELIAQEYYPCLRAATDHPVLMRICDKIIFDEDAPIRFQIERIVRVEAALGSCAMQVRHFLQTVLMLGAATVVYIGHHRVVGPGVGARAFFLRSLARNRRALDAILVLRRERALLHEDGTVRLIVD